MDNLIEAPAEDIGKTIVEIESVEGACSLCAKDGNCGIQDELSRVAKNLKIATIVTDCEVFEEEKEE